MGNNSLLLLLAPELVLTAGGLAILLAGLIWRRKESYRPLVYVAAAVGLVVLGVSLLSTVGAGLPQGMFVGDRLTSYIRVLAAGTTVLSLILALSRPQLGNEFPALLLFATLGITLAAGASNLVMIYVAIELLSITCYVLTGLFRDEARSNEAALKYFFYGAVASAVMVYGASFLYGLAGSPDLVVIAEVLSGTGAVGARWVAMPALILVMVGLGFKVAAVPFHQWSPDVYEGAPTPVTAYLSVGPKLAGFAVMMRVLAAMPAVRAETAVVVAVLAVLSMTVGNLVALSQSSLKRMLAYSSIAQAGYMLIGASVLAREGSRAPGGSAALLVYLLTYAVTNLGAFAVVQVVEERAGSDDIKAYSGLGQRAPGLAAALVFFFLSLVGIPPMACFLGKLFVFGAAINAGAYWLAAVGVANSVISLAYYFRVVRVMYFEAPGEAAAAGAVPVNLRLAVAVSWAGTLGLIALAAPVIAWAENAVVRLLP